MMIMSDKRPELNSLSGDGPAGRSRSYSPMTPASNAADISSQLHPC